MKILTTCLFSLLFPLMVFSQEIVLDEYPDRIYSDKKGPDSKYYIHGYISLGINSNYLKEKVTPVVVPYSGEFNFGLRNKIKLLSFYAMGFDASYRYQGFRIEKESGLPDDLNPFSLNWDSGKQILGLNSLGFELYNRLKAGRGNNLGYYFDAGIRGEWNFSKKLVLKNTYSADESPSGKIKTVHRKLSYVKSTSLIATARIGFKKNIIFGNYRISALFSDTYSIPELPKLTLGIQRVI